MTTSPAPATDPDAATDARALRAVLATSGIGWYPVAALSLLGVVDQFQGFAYSVLAPDIARSLGVGKEVLASLSALQAVALTLATLPMAAYVQRGRRRHILAIATAFAWAGATLFTGFVTTAGALTAILILDGLSSGSVAAVHGPLLVDTYPRAVRVRVMSTYAAVAIAGNIASPLLVGALSTWLHLTWRGIFVVMGALCVLAAVFSVRLRDRGYENEERIAAASPLAHPDDLRPEDVSLGLFEVLRRLLLVPTIRRLLAANAAMGMMLIPLSTYLFFFLEERWGMGPGARSVFFSCVPLAALLALTVFGPRAERLFQRNPSALVRLTAALLAGTVLSLALAILSPVFVGLVAGYATTSALMATINPALATVSLSLVPARMRPHAAALSGLVSAGVGGLGGVLLLGGIDRQFGTAGAIVSLAVPGLVAALILRSAARTLPHDMATLTEDTAPSAAAGGAEAVGPAANGRLLQCTGIDFSYGPRRILHGVDFHVDRGEIVALLGTNGAGKSTLLRVVSGLELPENGTVTFRGVEMTYLDAERRVAAGLCTVPGGRAVFGSMTVQENLRALAHGLRGDDRRRHRQLVQECLDTFPSLRSRLNTPAGSLSGGEQQMLALSKALILKPKLLLIDELSLGLAPAVVAQLLTMVRAINAAGTAVVLVEQSVNVALSLADRAYFMERGTVRFEGPAEQLSSRDDLVRAVFLTTVP